MRPTTKPKGKKPAARGGISGRLRELLRGLNVSCYSMEGVTGVHRNNLTAFLNGETTLTGESIDRICDAYGFALVDTRSGRKPRAARPAPAADDRVETMGRAVDLIHPPED